MKNRHARAGGYPERGLYRLRGNDEGEPQPLLTSSL